MMSFNLGSKTYNQSDTRAVREEVPFPNIGISIISWRSWKTLVATLTSYKMSGLLDMVGRAVIYFQDISAKDAGIAEHFGIDYIGGPNCGIGEGMRKTANYLGTDYILFLENDCPVIVDRFEAEKQLCIAVNNLDQGKIDVMRLRSRSNPGEAFADIEKYLRYYNTDDSESFVDVDKYPKAAAFRWLRRIFKPYNRHRMKGRSLYVEKAPEKRFPEVIQKTKDGVWICDSNCIDWTNQSVLCKRELFINDLMVYVDKHPSFHTSNGFQSPERPLNCAWWRARHLKIGQGEGIFTHQRYDGSWRKYHWAYENNVQSFPTEHELTKIVSP